MAARHMTDKMAKQFDELYEQGWEIGRREWEDWGSEEFDDREQFVNHFLIEFFNDNVTENGHSLDLEVVVLGARAGLKELP